MTDRTPTPNSPIAQLDEQARRQQRARQFRGGGSLPEIRYPTPPGDMTDEEVREWYEENHPLPPAENAKFHAVTALHEHAASQEASDRDVRLIMNAFYAEPEDVVDVGELLERLGMRADAFEGVDWNTVDVDGNVETEELLAELGVI